mgnify:CR=1 FL=1
MSQLSSFRVSLTYLQLWAPTRLNHTTWANCLIRIVMRNSNVKREIICQTLGQFLSIKTLGQAYNQDHRPWALPPLWWWRIHKLFRFIRSQASKMSQWGIMVSNLLKEWISSLVYHFNRWSPVSYKCNHNTSQMSRCDWSLRTSKAISTTWISIWESVSLHYATLIVSTRVNHPSRWQRKTTSWICLL